ncbi:hypothetical protein BKA81DRAFT_399758 [Phyllosticta paracitricarpa]
MRQYGPNRLEFPSSADCSASMLFVADSSAADMADSSSLGFDETGNDGHRCSAIATRPSMINFEAANSRSSKPTHRCLTRLVDRELSRGCLTHVAGGRTWRAGKRVGESDVESSRGGLSRVEPPKDTRTAKKLHLLYTENTGSYPVPIAKLISQAFRQLGFV